MISTNAKHAPLPKSFALTVIATIAHLKKINDSWLASQIARINRSRYFELVFKCIKEFRNSALFLSGSTHVSKLTWSLPQVQNFVKRAYEKLNDINMLVATVANKVHTASVFIKRKPLKRSIKYIYTEIPTT